ncbi:AP-4 complex accessory subunit tepsin [Suncus etruscus]|uniref:AP-4 complex accessory subunit tepsin n=1 Tax=Suncus etruscus TaxID=109475 RepID=UPI0021102BA1|nr:AP-4 complex accessory subunit tepsin [Suncus etruscus]
MAAPPPLRDRLLFLQRLPILLKGTADDEAPCPGYVSQEIVKLSHESAGSCHCLLEYLLTRLHRGSGHVKLKVLKLLLLLCARGSPTFLQLLQRNTACIQEAAVFAGPPDPLHGNSLYQKVRAAAQDLGSALFADPESPAPASQPPQALPQAGMGSRARPQAGLQGFGYTEERTGSSGETFLSSIQRAAQVVVQAMRPAPEGPATPGLLLRAGTYQPAVTPTAGTPSAPLLGAGQAMGTRAARHQPGRAGGGWDEPDSSAPSTRSDSDPSKVSEVGSDGDVTDRAEADTPQDCQPELGLVCAVTRGTRAFLSTEETRRFLKECSLLNCEVVLQLLLRHTDASHECVQMRVLSALAALGGSDLLAPEHTLLLSQTRLRELSSGTPGPVANKATKILRHLEASCRQQPLTSGPPSQAVAHGGLSDLLADNVPFTEGPTSLQPLHPSLPSPQGPAPPSLLNTQDPEDRPASTGEPDAGSEQGTEGPVGGPGSLFAGMELVVHEGPLPAPQASWTLPQRASAEERPHEPSAFVFLNL